MYRGTFTALYLRLESWRESRDLTQYCLEGTQANDVNLSAAIRFTRNRLHRVAHGSNDPHDVLQYELANELLCLAATLEGVCADANILQESKEQLQELLSANAVRIIDMFRAWDANGDNMVSKKEFKRAFESLGLGEHLDAVAALFDSFDRDGAHMRGSNPRSLPLQWLRCCHSSVAAEIREASIPA